MIFLMREVSDKMMINKAEAEPDKSFVVWPGSVEVKKLNSTPETVSILSNYILLSPDSSRRVQTTLGDIFAMEPYKEEIYPRHLQMKRFAKIDELDVVTLDGRKIKAGQVAEHNCYEIERLTRVRWEKALTEIFEKAQIKRIPSHREDGGLTVGVLGCEDGHGLGGLLEVLSVKMGLTVNLFGVDPREPGEIERIKDLLAGSVSTATLNRVDLRAVLWRVVAPDLVVFPAPGPFNTLERYQAWEEVVKKVAEAKPSIIIFSFPETGISIYDVEVKKRFLRLNEKMKTVSEENLAMICNYGFLFEERLFRALLVKAGYQIRAISFHPDNNIKLPLSIYGDGEKVGGEMEYLETMDPYFSLAVHKDALALVK